MGVTVNVLKTFALPPPGHASIETVFALLADAVVVAKVQIDAVVVGVLF